MLTELQKLGWTSHVPLAISILENSNLTEKVKENMIKLMYKHALSIMFKSVSIGTLDDIYNLGTHMINNKDINSVKKLERFLYGKLSVDEDSIKSSILDSRFGLSSPINKIKTKFILSKIFNIHDDQSGEYTIEHILPIKRNDAPGNENVNSEFDDDRKKYIEKIGNILLLEKDLNKLGSSKTFGEKLEDIYPDSKSLVTIDFSDKYQNQKLDKSMIDDRSKEISEKYIEFLNNLI